MGGQDHERSWNEDTKLVRLLRFCFAPESMEKKEMNTEHERTNKKDTTDEWLTPPEIIKALGPFDLDPCSPIDRPWPTAANHFTYLDNGLMLPWTGRVWCNPPYGKETKYWLEKSAMHKNVIVLIFVRTETNMFFDYIWPYADAVFFFKGRLQFLSVTGESNFNAGAPSMLVVYGKENIKVIAESNLKGKLIILKK